MPFDVLIITALFDELTHVLKLTEGNDSRWQEDRDPAGFQYHYCEFSTMNEPMRIAAAWSGQMGEVAAADRCRALISYLKPLCVAMSGICAGRRKKVFLGDVIVANRIFSYDHGKLIAVRSEDGQRVEQFLHDIETYNLEKTWAMDATYFASKQTWCEHLLDQRPLSLDAQRRWLLNALFEHETKGAPTPNSCSDRKTNCPRWADVIPSLQKLKLVTIEKGTLKLSDAGREQILNDQLLYPDGMPSDPPFRVHVGAIGTGKTVRQDPEIFERLEKFERTVLGLEMEGAAIGYVAENARIPSIIVKAVADYADENKDDSFRMFACRASAEFLLAFLKQHPPRSLQRKWSLLPATDMKELSKQISATVLSSLMEKGVEVKLPRQALLKRFLFYCTTKTGSRVLGVALNNTGLIAYASTDELIDAVSLQGDIRSSVVRHIEGNQLMRFAILDCFTQGVTSSYWDTSDLSHLATKKVVWTAFNHEGNPVKLTLSGVRTAAFVKLDNDEEIMVENLLEATADVSVWDVLSGPVITEQNELVGFVVLMQVDPPRVFIWPWASLKSCLSEAKIERVPEVLHHPIESPPT